jgi:hypothetical protein
VADLALGVGLLIFVLAPFALPFLALLALVAVLMLIPVLPVALLLAPLLLARRDWRSRKPVPAVTMPDRSRDGDLCYENVRYELVGRGGSGR